MASGRAKLDSMWRAWYAGLVLLLHAFLLYSAARRYAQFRHEALRGDWETAPMNLYLAMMILVPCLLLLFLFSTFAGVGNFAEEGAALGSDEESLRLAARETSMQHSRSYCCLRLRRHCLPHSCVLHIIMAVCLLLPMPALQAARYRHLQLPDDSVWSSNADALLLPDKGNAISAEFFNLVLALCLLLVRYPAVFWFANRPFALLFSLVLFACCVHTAVSQEASSVLYRIASTRPNSELAPGAVLPLAAVGDLLLLLGNAAFFEFGYAQLVATVRRYKHCLQLESASNCGSSCSSCSGERAACWLEHGPQLLGAGATCGAALCKAPLLWQWTLLFRRHRHPLPLAAVATFAAYAALWLGAWLLLTLKSRWSFRVQSERLASCHANRQDGSELSAKSNQYLYMQRVGEGMVPTVAESVDNGSENSYGDRQQCGLVKYQVRGAGSLKRSSRASAQRVTFKDTQDTIPGSPGSSQNASSSDSGIEAPGRQQAQEAPEYAHVGRPRPPSRQGYEEYQLFGSLFTQQQQQQQQQQPQQQPADIYSRVLPPPPTHSDPEVPDILLQQQQQQQLAASRSGSFGSLPPPPPELDDAVDGLCSQV